MEHRLPPLRSDDRQMVRVVCLQVLPLIRRTKSTRGRRKVQMPMMMMVTTWSTRSSCVTWVLWSEMQETLLLPWFHSVESDGSSVSTGTTSSKHDSRWFCDVGCAIIGVCTCPVAVGRRFWALAAWRTSGTWWGWRRPATSRWPSTSLSSASSGTKWTWSGQAFETPLVTTRKHCCISTQLKPNS